MALCYARKENNKGKVFSVAKWDRNKKENGSRKLKQNNFKVNAKEIAHFQHLTGTLFLLYIYICAYILLCNFLAF